VMTSRQYGIQPQELLSYLQQQNQLPAMFADVRRGKTIAAAVEAATVSDTDGNVIDTSEFFGTRDAQDAEAAEDPEDAETDEADASSEEQSGDTK
jgi:trigger factor